MIEIFAIMLGGLLGISVGINVLLLIFILLTNPPT